MNQFGIVKNMHDEVTEYQDYSKTGVSKLHFVNQR